VEASQDPQASPPPEYPRAAKRQRHQGTVLIWVEVSIEGTLQALGIEKSSGYRSLDQAALSAISRWGFIPAVEDGRPVPGRTEVSISFQLID
jgi:protein TonB